MILPTFGVQVWLRPKTYTLNRIVAGLQVVKVFVHQIMWWFQPDGSWGVSASSCVKAWVLVLCSVD